MSSVKDNNLAGGIEDINWLKSKISNIEKSIKLNPASRHLKTMESDKQMCIDKVNKLLLASKVVGL